MKTNLQKAKETLAATDATCVLCQGEQVFVTQERGVKPLLQWLDSGKDFRLFSAADKVVGNGAAFLYVLLGIQELHAGVISQSACHTLKQYNIAFTYDTLVPMIRNRTNTGICPMEEAVIGITDPQQARIAIIKKIAALAAQKNQ